MQVIQASDRDMTPYCGPAVGPQDILYAWNGDLWLLTGLTAAAMLALWFRATNPASPARDRAMMVGFAGLFLAFVSPLCAATVALFAARSVHHLVLICVVAPAFAIALPLRMLRGGVALGLTSAALVFWHVPAVYDAAWISTAVYWTLQAGLLLPAWMFWSAVLSPPAKADVLFGHALLVGGLAGVMGLIGAILTFVPRSLYPQHLTGTEAFGLTLLADQQLAGLIMWVPGFLPLAAVAFLMLRRGWKQGFSA